MARVSQIIAESTPSLAGGPECVEIAEMVKNELLLHHRPLGSLGRTSCWILGDTCLAITLMYSLPFLYEAIPANFHHHQVLIPYASQQFKVLHIGQRVGSIRSVELGETGDIHPRI